MDKTHHRTVEKELWKVFDKLRGVEFHGPEELAEFLKYENIHFTADELVAFGTILATRYKRLGPPALHIPRLAGRRLFQASRRYLATNNL